MIYFDHNATTPLLPEAQRAWVEATEKFIGNPSSPHRLGSRAEAALQQARERLAELLGCAPYDIVWTSGATESNNLVLHHCSKNLAPGAEVWVASIEHPCVLESAANYFPEQRKLIPAHRSGVIDLDWFRNEIGARHPGLTAVMAANNETGVLQPWREVLTLCQEFRIPFFCDAAQWVGKLSAKGLGECDFVSGCAHKFGGPKGVGFLKCPSSGRLSPMLVGGGQEDGRRAGTENVPGVLAMLAALEACESLRADNSNRAAWQAKFETQLLKKLHGTEILGAGQERLWNTVSALMPEADCQQRWVVKLDKLGLAVSTGSACASGREEPSHVLQAMGCTAGESGRVLRFSSGWNTTEADWLSLLGALIQVNDSKGGQANKRPKRTPSLKT